MKFFYTVTFFACIISQIVFVFGMMLADSAPKEAVVAAACATAVIIPYIFSRAIEKIERPEFVKRSKAYEHFEMGELYEHREKWEQALDSFKNAQYFAENDVKKAKGQIKNNLVDLIGDIKLSIHNSEKHMAQ